MKRYQIIRTYEIFGERVECLCCDAGSAIVSNEEAAKAQVAKLHEKGYTDARYEELPRGETWFDDRNWVG